MPAIDEPLPSGRRRPREVSQVWDTLPPAHGALHRAVAGSFQGLLAIGVRLRSFEEQSQVVDILLLLLSHDAGEVAIGERQILIVGVELEGMQAPSALFLLDQEFLKGSGLLHAPFSILEGGADRHNFMPDIGSRDRRLN
jgi:hypothetical protein